MCGFCGGSFYSLKYMTLIDFVVCLFLSSDYSIPSYVISQLPRDISTFEDTSPSPRRSAFPKLISGSCALFQPLYYPPCNQCFFFSVFHQSKETFVLSFFPLIFCLILHCVLKQFFWSWAVISLATCKLKFVMSCSNYSLGIVYRYFYLPPLLIFVGFRRIYEQMKI